MRISDKERLDFLDSINRAFNERNRTGYGWGLTSNHNRIALENHHYPALDVRQAIDAAMRAERARRRGT